MIDTISKFHRFLSRHSVYPIMLSSLLALTIYAGRILISHSWRTYANLIWNLFLAWLPFLFSLTSILLYRIAPKHWWLLIIPGFMWLVFFPNAPYIVTDFFHLEKRPHIPLWYDILLLTTFSWTGIFLALASLRSMQGLVKTHMGTPLSWIFAASALSLAGLGIYLGRFERWNSWDLLFQPRIILSDIAHRMVNPFNNIGFFAFTILFTAFLLVCYLMFVSMRQLEESNP